MKIHILQRFNDKVKMNVMKMANNVMLWFLITQEGDEYRYDSVCGNEILKKEIRTWVDYQDGQKILMTTPVVLLGSRLEVYRAEGTTQWYTAFIHSLNDASKVSIVYPQYSSKFVKIFKVKG